jgi:hypothetical protein
MNRSKIVGGMLLAGMLLRTGCAEKKALPAPALPSDTVSATEVVPIAPQNDTLNAALQTQDTAIAPVPPPATPPPVKIVPITPVPAQPAPAPEIVQPPQPVQPVPQTQKEPLPVPLPAPASPEPPAVDFSSLWTWVPLFKDAKTEFRQNSMSQWADGSMESVKSFMVTSLTDQGFEIQDFGIPMNKAGEIGVTKESKRFTVVFAQAKPGTVRVDIE